MRPRPRPGGGGRCVSPAVCRRTDTAPQRTRARREPPCESRSPDKACGRLPAPKSLSPEGYSRALGSSAEGSRDLASFRYGTCANLARLTLLLYAGAATAATGTSCHKPSRQRGPARTARRTQSTNAAHARPGAPRCNSPPSSDFAAATPGRSRSRSRDTTTTAHPASERPAETPQAASGHRSVCSVSRPQPRKAPDGAG
jgi:hypothetical protein